MSTAQVRYMRAAVVPTQQNKFGPQVKKKATKDFSGMPRRRKHVFQLTIREILESMYQSGMKFYFAIYQAVIQNSIVFPGS